MASHWQGLHNTALIEGAMQLFPEGSVHISESGEIIVHTGLDTDAKGLLRTME